MEYAILDRIIIVRENRAIAGRFPYLAPIFGPEYLPNPALTERL